MTPIRRLMVWVTVFLVAVTVMLAATAPAALPASMIEIATAGRLKMVSSSGSAWHGDGLLMTAAPSALSTEQLAVHWTTDFSSMYRGELVVHIDLGAQSLRITATPSRWSIDSAGARLPMAFLRPFFPRLVANSSWTGEVRLAATGFGQTWVGSEGAGSARLEVKSLAVAEFSATPLGSYQLDLKPDTHFTSLALTTLAGPLKLEGGGRAGSAGMSCEIRAELAQEASDELGKILNHVARREAGRVWSVVCPGHA